MDELPNNFFLKEPHTKRCTLKGIRPNFQWTNKAIDAFIQLTKEDNLTVRSVEAIDKSELLFELDIFCGNL